MIMLVDIGEASVPFEKITETLDGEAERLGVNVRIQREEIFDAMHRI
jgi:ACT domain-containing protein